MARCRGTAESLCQGRLDLDDDDKFGAMCTTAFGCLQEWPDLGAMCGANLGVPAMAGNGNESSCSGSGGSRKRKPDAYDGLDATVRGSGMGGAGCRSNAFCWIVKSLTDSCVKKIEISRVVQTT
jgi:hypothetical protein